jgi:hypothetical protein
MCMAIVLQKNASQKKIFNSLQTADATFAHFLES